MVRGLCKFFEGPVTAIFSGYVNSMLAEYAKNPGQNWKHKDAAIYLVTSLASKGQTQKVGTELLEDKRHLSEECSYLICLFFLLQQHGITQANQLVNLNEFFVNHILTDLKSPNSRNPL